MAFAIARLEAEASGGFFLHGAFSHERENFALAIGGSRRFW
jgi:hypothetical protein